MRVRFSEKPYDFDPVRDMPVYRLLAVPCLGDRFGPVASHEGGAPLARQRALIRCEEDSQQGIEGLGCGSKSLNFVHNPWAIG